MAEKIAFSLYNDFRFAHSSHTQDPAIEQEGSRDDSHQTSELIAWSMGMSETNE